MRRYIIKCHSKDGGARETPGTQTYRDGSTRHVRYILRHKVVTFTFT